jgi:glutamate synthase domain-containing protein 3
MSVVPPLESICNINLETVSPLEMLFAIQKQKCERLLASRDDANGVPLQNVSVVGAKGQDYIGSGIRGVHSITIQGSIGDFGMCSFGDGECNVDGNVGSFFGHSIHSGILVVRGNALHCVGAMGVGGLITIYGNAGDRVAIGMQGADVMIRGSVADYAGLGMQSGSIVVGGNAGHHLGKAMRGGTIYLRGEAESVSEDVEERRLREPDRLKIGLLMLKAGIKITGKEFRVFRPVQGVP